jgi:hypothetical protein
LSTPFAQYLRLDSVNELQQWLEQTGFRSKRWTTSAGRGVGGAVFSRGALLHLLKNRVYLGEISHKAESFPAAHPPIVPRELFEAVQAKLQTKARPRGKPRGKAAQAPLCQLLFDIDGHPMSPTHARGKRGKAYRYYVSSPLQRGGALPKGDAIRRAPAEPLEAYVAEVVGRVTGARLDPAKPADWRRVLARVELRPASTVLHLRMVAQMAALDLSALSARLEGNELLEPDPFGQLRLTIAARFQVRGGRTFARGLDPAAPRRDAVLIRALRRAHDLLSESCGSGFGFPERALLTQAPVNPYERKLLRLAFLAPDLQRDIIAGRHPAELNLERLMEMEIPASWAAQRAHFARLR